MWGFLNMAKNYEKKGLIYNTSINAKGRHGYFKLFGMALRLSTSFIAKGAILGLAHSVLYRTLLKDWGFTNRNRIILTCTILGGVSTGYWAGLQAVPWGMAICMFGGMALSLAYNEYANNALHFKDSYGVDFGNMDSEERKKRK